MLKGVGRLLSSIQRPFLWYGCTKQRSFYKIQWRLVMRNKKQGGLGVSSLISKNRALLLKWIWRLSSPCTSLWKMIISSMYNPAYENGILIFYNQPSKIWKDIMSIVQTDAHHVFTNHCKFMVENGSLTSFWLDNWIGDYLSKQPSLSYIFCLSLNLLWWLTWVDGAMESGSGPYNGADLYFILNKNNYHFYHPCWNPSQCSATRWIRKSRPSTAMTSSV